MGSRGTSLALQAGSVTERMNLACLQESACMRTRLCDTGAVNSTHLLDNFLMTCVCGRTEGKSLQQGVGHM